jgi:hypothetical protein
MSDGIRDAENVCRICGERLFGHNAARCNDIALRIFDHYVEKFDNQDDELQEAKKRNEDLEGLQCRCLDWAVRCFGESKACDKSQRNFRFLEEAIELVQSLGCSVNDAHRLVDYVYGRPAGDPHQEVGGALLTLMLLCEVNGMDCLIEGRVELDRVNGCIDNIRAKQALKPDDNTEASA